MSVICPKLFFSDDFIQAQQQLARWASEEILGNLNVLSVKTVTEPSDLSEVGPLPVAVQNVIYPIIAPTENCNGQGATVSRTDYYPSPPSTETESSGSVMAHPGAPQRPRVNGPQDITNTGHYPEYKH